MNNGLKPEEPSGYYIFGTDIFAIPCFRTSFLAGFISLTSTSLLTFLFTSNSRKSFNYAFGAFMLTTFPYMMYCQNQHYDSLLKLRQVQDKIKEQTNNDYMIVDELSSLPDSDLTPDAIV